MPLFSSYVDVPGFLTNGLPSSDMTTLVGGNATLAGSGCLLGATTLTLNTPTTVFPTTVFPFVAWILDGPNSEYVSVTAVGGGGTTLTLASPGTQAAHAGGVNVSSAGTTGCLASVIATASSMVETVCMQGPSAGTDRSLFQQSRAERFSGPDGWRVAFDADATLTLRPYHFPVASVASISVQMGAQAADTIDLTYQWIPTDGRTVRIPWAQRAGTPPNLSIFPFIPYPRNLGFLATLTYTGGPCGGTTLDSVPFPIREATYLIVMDRLGFRKNPTGAAMVRLGDSMLETRLRGDTSGKSILRLQAEDYLGPYVYK